MLKQTFSFVRLCSHQISSPSFAFEINGYQLGSKLIEALLHQISSSSLALSQISDAAISRPVSDLSRGHLLFENSYNIDPSCNVLNKRVVMRVTGDYKRITSLRAWATCIVYNCSSEFRTATRCRGWWLIWVADITFTVTRTSCSGVETVSKTLSIQKSGRNRKRSKKWFVELTLASAVSVKLVLDQLVIIKHNFWLVCLEERQRFVRAYMSSSASLKSSRTPNKDSIQLSFTHEYTCKPRKTHYPDQTAIVVAIEATQDLPTPVIMLRSSKYFETEPLLCSYHKHRTKVHIVYDMPISPPQCQVIPLHLIVVKWRYRSEFDDTIPLELLYEPTYAVYKDFSVVGAEVSVVDINAI
ncbi:hypothetical protein Sjap_002475 [Stephania japonica]|uniref:Uncharacterized protein n=1 Tax=Stephania japonica TaxID=461633 RepID=A0AAP0KPJ8_9MAGN